MDPRERLRRDFETLQDRLPGTVFTRLERPRLRPLPGDGVYREREARLRGLHADGERDTEPFDAAMALVEAEAPRHE
ncbi:hypothetical protein [Azotobacter chroococcum]|uniref:Uncharacterized protein n=1 Tax=Azotobacter chroococcum TaxID=353 RepID=A0AAP9YJ12_9GAMM|nr:hypothetical protein [Azotobacter chroococcum]QQE91330.1 hypothetical protein GKQ51_23520 [Azotobacter chroococcum]QQE91380.1 hypothetical protein GKQ51_23835 [Azotobacter chroococcum]